EAPRLVREGDSGIGGAEEETARGGYFRGHRADLSRLSRARRGAADRGLVAEDPPVQVSDSSVAARLLANAPPTGTNNLLERRCQPTNTCACTAVHQAKTSLHRPRCRRCSRPSKNGRRNSRPTSS